MYRAGLTLAVSILLASSALAQSKGNVDAKEADPTQAPTLSEQEEQEKGDKGAGVALSGVGYLSYLAPFDQMGGFNLLLLQGEIRYDAGTWGLYATPRLKINNPGQQVADSYIFLQQGYGFWRHPFGEVKLGKVYGRFGRFWDYGFYGPIVANNDLKLTPDVGISAEGAPALTPQWRLEYALQYFAFDGHSWSLANASPLSFNRVRRTHIVVARAAPVWHVNDIIWGSLGLSGSRFNAAFSDDHQVIRGALDIDIDAGPLSTFFEIGRQSGVDIVTVGNLLLPSYSYIWTGVQLKYERVGVRYHYNGVRYDDASNTTESLHQPGVEVKVADFFSLMAEVAIWNLSTPMRGRGEKSFYLIAAGKI